MSAKPERDHTHYHSQDELKQHGLKHVATRSRCLSARPRRLRWRSTVSSSSTLTHKVAAAHREHGQDVSEPEQAAIDDIVAALNTTDG